MLKFDINLLFTVINVLILYVVVRIFLFMPVRKILDERRADVDAGLEAARTAKTEAEEVKIQYESKLAGAEEEKNGIIKDAHSQASREYDRIIQDAHTEAYKIIEGAKSAAEEEKNRQVLKAREEIADLVAEAATKIVTGSDSEENDRELYDLILYTAAEGIK